MLPSPDLQQSGSLPISYVLPISASTAQTRALSGYLLRLSRMVEEVIVVDGSEPAVFAAHAEAWGDHVRHLPVAAPTPNGKVGGVITGVMAARHEQVVIADDDVRYRRTELAGMAALLARYDIVRPQNWFWPLPWHARWDTARSLLARMGRGDWPGTLGVRRSGFVRAGGYAGEVMFENLELVRTLKALGGRECVARDLFVVRRPPSTGHFLRQRVRQAYDELARPCVLVGQLAILPVVLALIASRRPRTLGALAMSAVAMAEAGRRRAGGQAVFPGSSALWAPLWLAERAFTAWAALGTRLLFGGVRYRTGRLRHSATPNATLRARLSGRSAHHQHEETQA